VRDDGDLNRLSGDLRDGETDAVQRDGALRDDLCSELRRQLDGESPVGDVDLRMQRDERDERCGRVDVTLHDVAAERRSGGRWQLEVDDSACGERAKRRAREGLGGEIGGEVGRIAGVERGEADAVDGDAVSGAPAAGERGRGDGQPRGGERDDGSGGFDEAGKHIGTS